MDSENTPADPLTQPVTDQPQKRGLHAPIPVISYPQLELLGATRWHAFCVVGPEYPIPRHLGDVIGAMSFYVVLHTGWSTSYANNMARYQQHTNFGLWFRMWAPSDRCARELKRPYLSAIAEKIVPLRIGYELKPGFTIDDLRTEFARTAEKRGIEVLDDVQLLKTLTAMPPQ